MDRLAAIVQQQADAAQINRREMLHAIKNLIIGNEAARELANKAGQLAMNVSQRLMTNEVKHQMDFILKQHGVFSSE
ncbi:MAG: hypothetical protein ACREDR_20805 [Blastocatellia bacterium]